MKVTELLKPGTVFKFTPAWHAHGEFSQVGLAISLGVVNFEPGRMLFFVDTVGTVRQLRYYSGSPVSDDPHRCFEVLETRC